MQLPPPRPFSLVTSTVAEIENLMPLLSEFSADGRAIDILYGIPFNPTALRRINRLNRQLLENAPLTIQTETAPISVLVDNAEQLKLLTLMTTAQIEPMPGVFIKIDTGYHRAGISWGSQTLKDILQLFEQQSAPRLRGLYSHLGHSYGFATPQESLEGLLTEIRELMKVAELASKVMPPRRILLSVGATPTATAAQNLLLPQYSASLEEFRMIQNQISAAECELELHAGVYPFLDLQQVATGARPARVHETELGMPATLSVNDIAIRILAEVSSVYRERSKQEALVAAGSLALGREPCKSYPGWGIVTPWKEKQARNSHETCVYDPFGDRSGWIVGRISQEHGSLVLERGSNVGEDSTSSQSERNLTFGEKILIWPNHACIAAACFGWYYVVDSSEIRDADIIRDVWVRWRGW